MENPDTPWLREYEGRSPKPFTQPPSPAAVFFLKFLESKGARTAGATLADIGCGSGRDSVFFARNGFEVHAIDRDSSVTEGLDMHSVRVHCHSAMDAWLFEDAFFDFAIDVLCYGQEQDAEGKRFYRRELKRTLKPGGYYLLCVPAPPPASPGAAAIRIAKEFSGFTAAASEESDDAGKRVLSIVLQAKAI
ncbi:MAG: class I SAM-dependent methyltransferase [Candidatus ainarchaeum sp.]|nr:class I SAM-dependent methyltransferase [Candidatus ainarchaeum sp.]